MHYKDLAQSSVLMLPAQNVPAVSVWARSLVHKADYWEPADLTTVPSVEDIKSLLHFANHTPVGESKLALIPAADQWRREVANMLLKLVEEPPSYLKIILVSSGSVLLPTLRSRVRVMELPVGVTGELAARHTGATGWKNYLEGQPTETAEQVERVGKLLYKTGLLHSTIQHDIVQEGLSS